MENRWSDTTRYAVLIALAAGVIWLVSAARPLIGPLIVSALLAFSLNPVVGWLCRRTRLKHGLAVGLVYTLFAVIIVAIPVVATPYLVRQLRGFSETLIWVLNTVANLISRPFSFAGFSIMPTDWVANVDQFIAETITAFAGNAFNFLAVFTENMIWVLLTMVTLFYLLKDGNRLINGLLQLAPPQVLPEWKRLVREIDRAFGAFLRGQLLLMAIVGALAAIGGAAIGLPGALILGLLAGLLDVVPSLGPTVAGAVAVSVALVLGSSYIPIPNGWFGLIVAALYFLVQQAENIWLRPQIMSHNLRLHPGVVFVGVIGALAVQGILAAVLIVPIMASAAIIGRYIHAKLIDRSPWPEDPPTN